MTAKKAKVTKKGHGRTATASRPATQAASTTVQTIVNGQPSRLGAITPGDLTIAQAANNIAREHGIKSYSILLNGGMKVTTDEAGAPLAGATSLEVFAKETRG